MKKKLFCIISIMLLMLFLAACSSNSGQNNQNDNDSLLTIVDPAGNELTIPENLNTIISLAPSITEVLIDLGYGDKIIAIDTQSKDLAGLKDGIPQIDLLAPDIEKLMELKPDLIFASVITMAGGDDPLVQLRDVGIVIAYIPTSNSIAEIFNDLMFVAKVVGKEAEGQAIVDSVKTRIEEMKQIAATITDKKSVYFEIAAAPHLYSFGKNVFLNEMLEIIGAENILAKQDGWLPVSEETVIAENPDVIITNVNYIEDSVAEIKSRDGWKNITALQNDAVYYVDNMASSLPNHNIIKALEQMAKAVYPESY